MSKHLQHDLLHLERQLLALAAEVEAAVRKAVSSVLRRRVDLARDVIEGDARIDTGEVEIEEECLKILALHQPVAADLRFITACLKINNDLERIGDLACNIAKRAQALANVPPLAAPEPLEPMMESATRMLRESLDAFVKGDAAAARHVCAEDGEVDGYNREVIDIVHDLIRANPEIVEQGILLFSVSKSLERIADHATNIAEDVVYLVEGEIIRHKNVPDGGAPRNGRISKR